MQTRTRAARAAVHAAHQREPTPLQARMRQISLVASAAASTRRRLAPSPSSSRSLRRARRRARRRNVSKGAARTFVAPPPCKINAWLARPPPLLHSPGSTPAARCFISSCVRSGCHRPGGRVSRQQGSCTASKQRILRVRSMRGGLGRSVGRRLVAVVVAAVIARKQPRLYHRSRRLHLLLLSIQGFLLCGQGSGIGGRWRHTFSSVAAPAPPSRRGPLYALARILGMLNAPVRAPFALRLLHRGVSPLLAVDRLLLLSFDIASRGPVPAPCLSPLLDLLRGVELQYLFLSPALSGKSRAGRKRPGR